MGDPVGNGSAQSLARPGGNLTGLSMGWTQGIGGNWLQRLHELVPRLSTVAIISHPDNPVSVGLAKEVEGIAPKQRLKVRILDVRGAEAFDGAFKRARREAQAAIVLSDPVSVGHRQQVVALAARTQASGDLLGVRVRLLGRADFLRRGPCQVVPSRGGIRRQDSQRCQSRRASHRTVDPVRAGGQHECRKKRSASLCQSRS